MSTIKSLRVLLRRTMAIALLSLPMEALSGDDRRIVLALDDTLAPDASASLLDALEKLDLRATLIPANHTGKLPGKLAPHESGRLAAPALARAKLTSADTLKQINSARRLLASLKHREPLDLSLALPDATQSSGPNKTSHWEPMPRPTQDEDPEEIVDFLMNNATPGAVLLLRPLSAEQDPILHALPTIGTRLREAGYEFATLSELLDVSAV